MSDHLMYIPTIGDEVTLAIPWTFKLYYEERNRDMIKWLAKIDFVWAGTKVNGQKVEIGTYLCEVQLPTGSILKVDRIYIRKGAGMKEFDSVTFILQSIPNKEIAVPREKCFYPKDGSYKCVHKDVTIRKVRFWAKLNDVNNMKFYKGREDVEAPEPSIYRRIICPEEEK